MSWILPLIIIACPLVNAVTFNGELNAVLAKGETSSIKSDLADILGFERSLPYRAIEIEDSNGIHDFNVILKDDKPLCVIVMVSSDTVTEAHSNIYRVSVKGKLERAFTDYGRYDPDHRPVRGSGVTTELKLTPEVKAAFQRELDFWIKEPYRKAANVTRGR